MARLKVGVLISGRGSNLQALIDACADPAFPAEIVLVLSNKADAYGLERARTAGIPASVVSHRDFADKPGFEAAMDSALRSAGVELVCLAGFMRLLTADFVERWRDRLINIHPSLLPSFKGLDTHARAIEAGGSTLRDYVQSSGELGYFQHQFAVYDREGQACPGCTCDVERTGGVQRIVQANRSTFYCPRRQR